MIEEKEFICCMLDMYGKLLTEKQLEVMNCYYKLDYSLNEIADNYYVTKQAVKDMISKGLKALTKYEEALKLASREIELRKVNFDVLSKKDIIKLLR